MFQVLRLESKLREHWCLAKFLAGGSDSHKKWRVDGGWEGEDFWSSLDAAVRDQVTWVGINVVYDVGMECEHVGRWAEACGCPAHQLERAALVPVQNKPKPQRQQRPRSSETARGFNQELCPYKGCRAPELAAGLGMQSQLGALMRNRDQILKHIERIPLQPGAQTDLLNDWHTARSRLWGCLGSGLV